MSTKQRVFSPNNIIHYDEYLKIKQGTECLKTINANNRTKHITLNQFVNYDQFMYLSKAFYKQVNMRKCKNKHVTNLYNANVSYIQHNQHNQNILKPSIEFCNSQILYPYGQYTQHQTDNFYFPYKIDMKQMCREKDTCYDDVSLHASCDKNNLITPDCNNCKSNNSKRCKTGLCKNAKQLFI